MKIIPNMELPLLNLSELWGMLTWLVLTGRFSPAARPSCSFLISVIRLALLPDTAVVNLCSLCSSFWGLSALSRSSPAEFRDF